MRSHTSPPKPPFAPIIIPLANLPAADISLRPELSAVLSHTNIECKHLITLDDLSTSNSSLEKVLEPDRTRWILVDHNAMTGTLGSIYGQMVVGVIDHHEDEGKVPEHCESEPRIIEKSGSCASLVTNYLGDSWNRLSESQDNELHRQCDAHLAKMAMASILVDTTNMTVSTKVTPHDTNAMEYLESKTPDLDTDKFFDEIQNAKTDIGQLKLDDILRKDYKEWEAGTMKLGVAAVVKPMEFLINKAHTESRQDGNQPFVQALREFSEARKLDVLGIMTMYTDNDRFCRQLLVLSANTKANEAVSRFKKDSSSELGLKPLNNTDTGFENDKIQTWQQMAVQHSRKQVAPLLRNAMNQDPINN